MGNILLLMISLKSLANTGDSSDAHSLRTRGGIPSEPYAFVTSRFSKARWTRWVEIIGGGMGEEGGGLGGKGALESSKVEFLLNMFEKAVAFSRGVVAIVESGSIKGGVEE